MYCFVRLGSHSRKGPNFRRPTTVVTAPRAQTKAVTNRNIRRARKLTPTADEGNVLPSWFLTLFSQLVHESIEYQRRRGVEGSPAKGLFRAPTRVAAAGMVDLGPFRAGNADADGGCGVTRFPHNHGRGEITMGIGRVSGSGGAGFHDYYLRLLSDVRKIPHQPFAYGNRRTATAFGAVAQPRACGSADRTLQ